MRNNFRSWLSYLPIDDPLERRQAGLFQAMLLILIGGSVIGLILASLLAGAQGTSIVALISYPLLIVCNAGALALLRSGRFSPAVILAIVGLIAGIGLALIATGFTNSAGALLSFAIPITLAGLVVGRRGLQIAAGLSIGVVVLAGVLQAAAPALVGFAPSQPATAANTIPTFILLIAVLSLFLDRFGNALREALQAATAREQELDRLRASLETTVAERTASLHQALQAVEQRESRLALTLGELQASQSAVRELSAPVLPVLPGVLIAPLIGALDSDRARVLADNVLGMVEREGARQVIFDITGVPVVDTQVAQVLLQTAAAVRLLGAAPLLVGIRPEVAQTIVTLGLDFAAIATHSDLQEAVGAILEAHASIRSNGAARGA
jgi:anti-anti-sigma regulatory factor